MHTISHFYTYEILRLHSTVLIPNKLKEKQQDRILMTNQPFKSLQFKKRRIGSHSYLEFAVN